MKKDLVASSNIPSLPLFKDRKPFYVMLFVAVFALSVAYIAEYGFGFKPCQLCFFQRYIYFALIGAALFGIFGVNEILVLALCVILGLLSFVLAGYHVAVEAGIFDGLDSCVASLGSGIKTLEELKSAIMNQPIASCQAPSWKILGISATYYSTALSFAWLSFAELSLIIAIKNRSLK